MVPSVLLLDDGELEDIQNLLEQLKVAFARIRGGAIVSGTPPPRDVLIATPRRIDAVARPDASAVNVPVRIVVVQDTNLRVPHAVLAVGRGNDILVLDNQVRQVLPHRQIVHYAPVYSINQDSWRIHLPRGAGAAP